MCTAHRTVQTANRGRFLWLCLLFLPALLASGMARQNPSSWQAWVSPAGSVRLRYGNRDMGALEPGLFEVPWRMASLVPAPPGQMANAGTPLRGRIRAPGGAVVQTEMRVTTVRDGIQLTYRLTPQEPVALNSLHVSLSLPVRLVTGAVFVIDGERVPVPDQWTQVHLRERPARTLDLTLADGAQLQWRFPEPTLVLLQDDRQWGPTITVRIGPQMDGKDLWPAGRALQIAFTLTARGGLQLQMDGPVTITPGPEWIPLETRLDVVPGSAIDFSNLTPWHTPAGRFGRVIVNTRGQLAFAERPQEPVRFYGVNLSFGAQYLTQPQADRFAQRLRRQGYNAVRLHHYEGMLIDRTRDGIHLRSDALDQLDYLFAAFKKQGIYVTTDLFVSRPVPAGAIWEGATGEIEMDAFKMAVPVNERAFANFKAFARALLDHRNPYTGMRWAEDPALAWISLINEGNPGNFRHLLQGNLRADYMRAWNAFLAARYPTRDACARALGGLPDGQDPGRGNVPLPETESTPAWTVFNVFLAENQREFFRRTRQFLREELGCRALLTNLNAWTNPLSLHTVRTEMDYVDDHFYVDHPEFLEQPWRLPSRCPNVSPVAQGSPGGIGNAFHRLFDRPFAISEFNYSGPGRFRGAGGILTGALGALQDWAMIWRYSYSHSQESLFTPAPAGYFDLIADPLSLASDRASLCLFRRGDMQPAHHAIAIAMTPQQMRTPAASVRRVTPDWNVLALITRVGTLISEKPGPVPGVEILLPLQPAEHWGDGALKLDPYGDHTGTQLLAEMRRRGWLKPENPTDLKAGRFQSETAELTLDAAADTFVLDTPRTAGGYAPAGQTLKTRALTVQVQDVDATVWVSSVDGQPIARSRRLLITHLTDLQNNGARFADRARQVLLEWGELPHLVLRGRATVTVRMARPDRARVWALATDGARLHTVPAQVRNGALVVSLDVRQQGKACLLYEIEVPS